MLGGSSEHPELWAFLEALRPGQYLTGAVAAIERFGVFVTLDDGPPHPVFAGVGFITLPELSWRPFTAASDIVQPGQRITGEFVHFDTWNLEARLSLRATQPDPFQTFADDAANDRPLTGQVTRLVPFGAFVQVADGVEGLLPAEELARTPQAGEELAVTVAEIDRERRRLRLGLR